MRRIIELDQKLQKAYMATTLIDAYLSHEGAGGTLHIILDDGNYKDSDVQYCLNYAKEKGDLWGEKIAELLIDFTEEEREKIVEKYWEINKEIETLTGQ